MTTKKIIIDEKKIPFGPIHFLNKNKKIQFKNNNIGGNEKKFKKNINRALKTKSPKITY